MTASGPDCVKTSTRGERAELSSVFSSFDGACQSGSFLIQCNRDKRSTRKFDVGVFTQPGSKTVLTAPKRHFCFNPINGHRQTGPVGPVGANSRPIAWPPVFRSIDALDIAGLPVRLNAEPSGDRAFAVYVGDRRPQH